MEAKIDAINKKVNFIIGVIVVQILIALCLWVYYFSSSTVEMSACDCKEQLENLDKQQQRGEIDVPTYDKAYGDLMTNSCAEHMENNFEECK